ncbi:hypothetical protein [Pseudacidovorax sp. NFM-22]|uniref:hypothetical protein n=1 Tax=Pseudacidovorax sp. NFM-22 TaxID=2744469 RepID=UPI001F161D03|nr:hypothetical protein [Pseudacidovorax sp. NFM-22]
MDYVAVEALVVAVPARKGARPETRTIAPGEPVPDLGAAELERLHRLGAIGIDVEAKAKADADAKAKADADAKGDLNAGPKLL